MHRTRFDQVHHVVDRPALAAVRAPDEVQHAVEALAGLVRSPALDDRLPGDPQFLRVAAAVGPLEKCLRNAQFLQPVDVDDGMIVPGEPAVEHDGARPPVLRVMPADDLAGLVGAEVQLQRIGVEALAAIDVEVGVVVVHHRRRIVPVDAHVERFGIVHHRDPRAEAAQQSADVRADRDPSGLVPIFQVAIDDDLAGSRHGVQHVIVGPLAPAATGARAKAAESRRHGSRFMTILLRGLCTSG